jgi:hypothetical protein
MFSCKSIVVGVALLFLSSAAQASSEWGRLDWIAVRATDGLVYFAVEVPVFGGFPPRTPRPPCATQGYWILGDIAKPAVRLQYDLLIRSQTSGLPVRVDGTGACGTWPDAEDVETVQLG